MPYDGIPAQRVSLRPHLVKSLALHAVVFALITAALLSEGKTVARQESLRIAEVQAQEQREAHREREARERAVEDLLADQLQTEMDALIAEELQPEHERQLSTMTAEDIAASLEQLNYDDLLEQLTQEQFAGLTEDLRAETLEQMRANLQQMRQDLLLSQVRSFIRRVVAPEIKHRIEQRLKNEVGQQIDRTADAQSRAEKSSRIGQLHQALQGAVKELQGLKSGQDGVGAAVKRRQLGPAAESQDKVRAGHAANVEKVNAILDQVHREAPRLAAEAQAARQPQADGQIAEAMGQTRSAIDAAQAADARAKALPDKAERQKADEAVEKDRQAAAARSEGASQKLTERIKDLQALSAALLAESRKAEPDGIQKQLVQAALKDVEPAVRQKIEKEVKETAIPVAADRILEALDKDLQKRKLNTAAFREFLKKDIEQALREETAANQPRATFALERTKDRFDLRDRKDLDQARKELAEVARRLNELADRQERIRDEPDANQSARHALRQRELAQEIKDAAPELARRLEEAGKATLKHDGRIHLVSRELQNPAVEAKARQAAAAVEKEDREEGKTLMTEVAESLRQSASALEGVRPDLAQEAGDVQQRAREHMDLAKALGEDKAAQAARKLAEAADRTAEERVKPAVAAAAGGVDLRGMLTAAEDAQALAKMDSLEEKLGQVAENLAEGRGLGEDPGMGMIGPGVGRGMLGGAGGVNWGLPYRRTLSQFNREAYEKFVKDMRHRLNPDSYYAPAEEVQGLDSIARVAARDGAAVVFIEGPIARAADANAPRKIPEPNFPYRAFGAAAMMDRPVVIDGDPSDWGELRHPLVMQYRGNSPEKIEGGPSIYVRWTPDGLYFAYTVQDTNGIQPCKDYPWSGDCLEVMVDMANTRRPEAYLNLDAQKFCFTPFGCRGNTEVTVHEMGRGLRGMLMARDYPDTAGLKGKAAARIIPGYGYSVEGFLSRRALTKPILAPGRFVAMNFSLNQDYSSGLQWSASQYLQTWRHPDTWGDLLLLGSDAKVRFLRAADGDARQLTALVPGDVLGLEVADMDMNLNTQKTDRVLAELKAADSGASLLVVLAETAPSSGVFRGSVHTQPYFLPAKDNTLNIRSGSAVQLVYTDLRAEYGENNRKVTAELPVGWPVMKLGGE